MTANSKIVTTQVDILGPRPKNTISEE